MDKVSYLFVILFLFSIPMPVHAQTNEEMVLFYLKRIQDNFSSGHLLVPAMEDNSGQTFNNAVTAMAFILAEEKERAERILDFYAERADTSNMTLNKQNFFFNTQARGFFQNVDLIKGPYNPMICDRWMGDNAWLLIAYKYYEKIYSTELKPLYADIIELLKNLFIDFYIDDPEGNGGFIRHGWRWGPRSSSQPQNDYKLHETDNEGNPVGHEEGNIDAYAALLLCGEAEIPAQIKLWLDNRMSELESIPGISLPLDLYSWRSLAFTHEGTYYKELVMVPENDPSFKKQVTFYGKTATGFFSSASKDVNNVWVDGLGHMVCAFYASGYKDKAEFYSTQLDTFLVKRMIGGSLSLALPYTANKTGGYDWVDTDKGFSSSCAWYLFAKNGFNPFTLENNLTTDISIKEDKQSSYLLIGSYPNPFNTSTTISYSLPYQAEVEITVYDILGNCIKELYKETANEGLNKVIWNGENQNNRAVSSGIYFFKIKTDKSVLNGKMVLSK